MEKGKLLISIFGVILVLTSFVSAHTGADESAHHMMGGGWKYGMIFFGWAFMILVLVVLVLLIVWLIQRINSNLSQASKNHRRKKG